MNTILLIFRMPLWKFLLAIFDGFLGILVISIFSMANGMYLILIGANYILSKPFPADVVNPFDFSHWAIVIVWLLWIVAFLVGFIGTVEEH